MAAVGASPGGSEQPPTADDTDAKLDDLKRRFEALKEQPAVAVDNKKVPILNTVAFCEESNQNYQNMMTKMEENAGKIDNNLKIIKTILIVFLISAIIISLAYLIWLIVILTTDPETNDPEGNSFATTYNPITYYTQRARAAKSTATTQPQGMRQRASTASRRARRTSRR